MYDTDRYGTTVCCISSSKLVASRQVLFLAKIQKFNIELQVEGVPYGTYVYRRVPGIIN